MVSLLNNFAGGMKNFGDMLLEREIRKAAGLDSGSWDEASVQPVPTDPTAPTATTMPALPSAPAGTDMSRVDPETAARAYQVYTGLVKRGVDAPTAVGFAANAVHESAAHPDTVPGDMGASHGLFQWRGDRLTGYLNAYGNMPEQGSLDQQLDNVVRELRGPEAGAWKSILAASPDPASKAAAISQFYLRPLDTQAEITRRGNTANQLLGHFAQMGGGMT